MSAPTLVRPPETPAPDAERTRRLTPPRAVLVVLVGLLLAALLNPDDLLSRARHMSFGWQRDAVVTVAEANRDVSRTLWLDRPRKAANWLFGRDHSSQTAPVIVPVIHRQRTGAEITTADPLRVYLGGDSVAQSISRAFDETATATGLIRPTVEFRFATGLTRSDYFDWPARLRQRLVSTPAPELVIVMFGANDVQPIMTPSGVARPGTTAWLAEYRRRVDAVMSMFDAARVPLLWLGQPVMRSAAFDRIIRQMDGAFAGAAGSHRWVTFLDTRSLLANAAGKYAAYLPGTDGRPELVRAPDGIHLTAAGAQRVTDAIIRFIDDRWRLPPGQ